MPYIGHSPTQAGSYIEVDDFGSSFNGSTVAFTLQVGGVNITPNQQNLLVMIDGVLQQPSDAFSVSGSTITFTEAPPNGADLYCLLMGQSASIGNGTIGADELKISGDGTSGQLLKSDGDGTYSYLNQTSVTAGTATTLATARTINGVSFDGSANITVTADANTLSNTTLKSTVVNSSLTSVGTIGTGVWQGTAIASAYLDADTAHLSGTQTFSGAKTFTGGLTIDPSGDNYVTMTSGASDANLGFLFKNSSDAQKGFVLFDSDDSILTLDSDGVIRLDADGGQIQFLDGGTEIGVLENSSSDFVIESKVQDKDILFKGNDGGTGIELMRMNMSGANIGISTGNSIGAKLHVADNRSTAYSSTGEPAETIIAHNKNGTDNSGVNNYASLSFQVADGATSQGFLNYVRTGNNTGDFTFSQRTGSSSYAEAMRISSDGKIGIGHTTPQFGLTLAQGNTDKEAIGWEDASNTKRASIYTSTSDDFLTFNVAGGDRMKLGSNSSNWTLQLTGNSPYGMQITTTASNSSSHDMFVVKRGDGTKCFEIFGDGNVYGTNEFISDYGFRSRGTAGAAPSGDDHYNVPIKMVAYRKTVSSTDVSNGYIDFDTDIYRDNIISGITNHFGAAATNVNNIGYNPGYGHSLHFYAGGGCRLYFGGSVVQNDKMGIVLFFYGSTG